MITELADIAPADTAGLLLGRLDPRGHTVLFGDAAVGKGMIAAWWAACLSRGWDLDQPETISARAQTRHAMSVLVVDYEGDDWRSRVEAFGGDLKRIAITRPTAPLHDIADSLAAEVEERRVDYVIVNSALLACAGNVVTGEGAGRYFLALAKLGRPTLTVAHGGKSDLHKPFGSPYWHAAADLTVSVDARGYDDDRVLSVRKSRRGEDYRRMIEWDWASVGLPSRLVEKATARSQVELHAELHEALAASLGREPTQGECVTAGEGQLTLPTVKKAHLTVTITRVRGQAQSA